MIKKIIPTISIIFTTTLLASGYFILNAQDDNSWRYKMIVTVETPEGIVTGEAVRAMSNNIPLHDTQHTMGGNPADVRGEAVVVDMGKRGVLFALISHESDNQFYDTFPLPGRSDGQGGSTPEGIKYHASLPIGKRGVMDPTEPPGYPKLVTFTDPQDPKSVTMAQIWTRQPGGRFALTNDRMEELFGKGVKLRDITLEITDEPVTWGVVDQYLPWAQGLNGGYLHGGFTAKGAPFGLHGGNFSTKRK